MARKKTRRTWSDAEKEELIRSAPASGLAAFLKSRKINSEAWFRRMRVKYLEAHPGFGMKPLVELPAAVPVLDFKAVDTPTKHKMVLEHDALGPEDRAAWKKAHNAPQVLLTYYRGRMRKQGLMEALRSQGGKQRGRPPMKAEGDQQALLAEYKSLPARDGSKAAWLAAHNLNHQNMHDIKKRVAKAQLNGNLPALRSEPIPAEVHAFPAHNSPTLEDGVRYLEIKRDIFNEVIADLQRVLRGAR